MADVNGVGDDGSAAVAEALPRDRAPTRPLNGGSSPTLPKQLQALFTVAIAITAIAGSVLAVNLVNLRGATQQLDHYRAVHDGLERLQSSLLDAETGQRGYLLTGRPEYLEPYVNAKQAYPATMVFLDGMVDDDPELQQGLAQLRPLIDEKMAVIERTIARYQTFADVVPSDAGKRAMDRVRDVIGQMRSHVAAQIGTAEALARRNTLLTFAVAMFAGGIGVVALFVVRRAVAIEQRRRNAAEEELRYRSALLNAVTEGTEDWIFVKERDGRLIFVNRAVCRAFDHSPERLIGKLPHDYIVDPGEAEIVHANDMRIMANGLGERIEQVITHKGQRRIYISSKTPRFDAAGNVIGLIGIGTDITERKNAEEVLADVNRQLTVAVEEQTAQLAELSQHLMRVAEEERKRLAAELHDELGALHTVITMDLQAIAKEVAPTSAGVSDRLQQVLLLVDQARQIKRRIIADLRPVLLDDFGLLAAVEHYVELWSKSSHIKVTVEHKQALPPLAAGVALAFFRVVQESLNNVAKYAQAKEVRITFEHSGDELTVTVTDDGIGISPEALERPRSHGIIGMRQRIANFGGKFDIGPGLDGTGTMVSARVTMPTALT